MALHSATTPSDLQRAARRHLWRHFASLDGPEEPPIYVRGDGCHLWDESGRRYLDGLSSLFCVNAGHGRTELGEAAARQARRLGYATTWDAAHPPAIELAERIAGLAPDGLDRIFFTSGGSEAVESALKLARCYHGARGEPGRVKVVARELAYHGTTFGALSATGLESVRTPFAPMMPGGCHVPHTDAYRPPAGRDPLWAADAIEERIESEGPETVSAVILEPVQNSGGCLPPPPGYFARVREICDRHGVLFISDDTICSWGRLGTWFGGQRYDYVPDIITTAKGLTSAYAPMGAMVVSDQVAAPFTDGTADFAHGLTFGGHPVAAAVALANLDVLEREDLLGRVRRHEGGLRSTLEALHELPIVGDVRGAGYFWGIELVADQDTKRPFAPEAAHALTAGFLAPGLHRRGLICRSADRGYPVIQLAPPLIAGPEEFAEIGSILRAVLAEACTREAGSWASAMAAPPAPTRRGAPSTAADVVSSDPYTGEEVFRAPATDEGSIAAAITGAVEGAGRWAATPVHDRAAALARFAELVEAGAGDLAGLIVREVGKRRADAEAEVAWTALSARWYAAHPPGEERAGGARVLRRPLGVIAAVTPWNVPLVTPAWKWLPALMAGNAVVWKPSERATAVAHAAHDLLLEAGVPSDVVAVVRGGAAAARVLCADPRVNGIHFTGSEPGGRALAGLASRRGARCALEMSGLNPAVVLADADLDLAADCIVACATALAGQKCTATRRVVVAEPVHDALSDRLARRLEALRVGDPRDGATDVGPLISPAARSEAEARLDASLDAGARLIARATSPPGDALFAPALLTGLSPDDSLRTRELFAPVMTLEPFETLQEAWELANASPYGLSAAIYGADRAVFDEGAGRIRAGVVAINRRGDAVELEAPFGGHKRSGNGAPEGGSYAYAAVTDLQAVYA